MTTSLPEADPDEASCLPAVAIMLAAMFVVAAGAGSTYQEMLPSTFKLIVVLLGSMAAASVFFAGAALRSPTPALRWHPVAWLPLALAGYAVISAFWAHPYFAALDAGRWFVVALLTVLGLHLGGVRSFGILAWGIFIGGVAAASWAVLQFLFDIRLFPQVAHPASTFGNRNFFAEFLVAAFPFGAYLLARARSTNAIILRSAGLGLLIVALLMTGARGALLTVVLIGVVLLPLGAWRLRDALALQDWSTAQRLACAAVIGGTVLGLGLPPTSNAAILEEGRGGNAIQRAIFRAGSLADGTDDFALRVRLAMWRATTDMIRAHPLTGVGGGAWEVESPRFEKELEVEADFRAHNEYLQLASEYGLVGWAFILALAAFLAWSARQLWRAPRDSEAAARGVTALASLLALLAVSMTGFPWHLAVTAALLGLNLGLLAQATMTSSLVAVAGSRHRLIARASAAVAVTGLVISAGLCWRQAESEARTVQVARRALELGRHPAIGTPAMAAERARLVEEARNALRLNPYNRDYVRIVPTELMRWGDYAGAIATLGPVVEGRPYVIAMLRAMGVSHNNLSQIDQAQAYLTRAQAIRPDAPSVRALEVLVLYARGRKDEAYARAQDAIRRGILDFDLVNAASIIATQRSDWPAAIQAVELRLRTWPAVRPAEAYRQLAQLQDKAGRPDDAVRTYVRWLETIPPEQQSAAVATLPTQHQAAVRGALGTARR